MTLTMLLDTPQRGLLKLTVAEGFSTVMSIVILYLFVFFGLDEMMGGDTIEWIPGSVEC